MYDVLRADRCISANSIEARVPFGDLDFVRYVMAIDPEKKLNSYGKGKYLLRKAFEGDWLPPEILWREKAAFSDAVGHSMVDDIKEYAESLYTDEEFQLRRANYSAHCMPFTKESLFYREIFEKYYHDQSRTIVDFWMPNKAWPGCNVNDPPPVCWQTTALRACNPLRPAGYLAEFHFCSILRSESNIARFAEFDFRAKLEHRKLTEHRKPCGVPI